MANKVKIVGYAKKEFFNNGIEYRNFSPDLVGNQFASNDGTPVFTMGNFNISTNLDSKVTKNFVTNDFTNFMSLNSLNVDSILESVITKYSQNAKLNLDYDNVLTYAFFGSLKEYIRVSLENIIIKWPASLFVSKTDPTSPSNTGNTISNYTYNPVTDEATFEINLNRIQNPFEINYLSGGTVENTFNESNTLRNLVLNYGNYVLSYSGNSFDLTNIIGASGLTDTSITISTKGDPFPIGSGIIDYHIKPNKLKFEEFFFNLNEFENRLLNRLAIPAYTSNFTVFSESENGTTVESNRKMTWPVTDGYNIEFNSVDYVRYVNQLLELADINDSSRSNLMVRFLVSSSISEFDSIPDISGSYVDTNGQKMTNALKIYGREFDEIKNYSDGIRFANVVTYDKKNNTPDVVLKNLARVLGWELTSSISQVDVVGNFLSLNNNYYDGHSRGLSDAESELELWRRIIMNTPWLWKSKGTRKAIEFLFKFIGAPDGLVTFNEHLYVAESAVDIDLVEQMMEYFNNTSDISTLNVDRDGYPKILPNTPEMYFQKAGLWYRQTGGANPDIDVLAGNNPHIGPYDGGQAYINQFGECLVPNFVGGSSEDSDTDAEVNLFTNYALGTFNECCDSDIYLDVITNQNFQGILNTNQDKYLNNFPVTETGCTVTNNWTLIAQLMGETFYENTFFTNTGTAAITESDYINEIYNLSGETEFSGATFTTNSGSVRISFSGSCDSDLVDKFFKLELCVSTDYSCTDEGTQNIRLFQVPLKFINACSLNNPQQPGMDLWHNGTQLLPQIGDTVYTDSAGQFIFDTAVEAFNQSGNLLTPHKFLDDPNRPLSDPLNYLMTDATGVRIPITCPPSNCIVTTSMTTVGNNNVFLINGVTGLTQANVTFSLLNVVKTLPSDSVEATLSGFLQPTGTVLNQFTSTFTTNVFISPNGGFANIGDFDAILAYTATNGVTSFKVRMNVNSVNGECINGPTFQDFNYTFNPSQCLNIKVTNNSNAGGGGFNYKNCSGVTQFASVSIGDNFTFCGSLGGFQLPSGLTAAITGNQC